jgi:hypothetical protein
MRVVGDVPAAVVASLAGAERAQTLEDVLAWAHPRGAELVEVIVQDEYTHDVVARTSGAAYLCFDTT